MKDFGFKHISGPEIPKGYDKTSVYHVLTESIVKETATYIDNVDSYKTVKKHILIKSKVKGL